MAFVVVMKQREFAFVPTKRPRGLDLIEIRWKSAIKIRFVNYDPLRDKPLEPLCAHRPYIDVTVEYFFLHGHRKHFLVTRELRDRCTDEGIGPGLTLAILGRPRGGGRLPPEPRVAWNVSAVPLFRLEPRLRMQLRNMSILARNMSDEW